MASLDVLITLKCTVESLDEAYDALRNASDGAGKSGWDVSSAELRATPTLGEATDSPDKEA